MQYTKQTVKVKIKDAIAIGTLTLTSCALLSHITATTTHMRTHAIPKLIATYLLRLAWVACDYIKPESDESAAVLARHSIDLRAL